MTLIVVVGLASEARIIARPGVRVVIGGGQAAALADQLEAALKDGAAGVLSFGVCGALDLDLKAGDIVVASAVIVDGDTLPADIAWAAALAGGAKPRTITASDTVVALPRDKAALRIASGAAAVDMESGVAARAAARHDVRFAAVRAVSDSVNRGLPAAAIAGFRADGGVDVGAVLKGLAKAPWELPDLIRTGLDVGAAFSALRRFAATTTLSPP